MKNTMNTGTPRDARREDILKALKRTTATPYAAPKPQAARPSAFAAVRPPKPAAGAKSANVFYAKPVKGGTISSVAKPPKGMKPVSAVKPVRYQPKSLEQYQKDIEAQKQAIADLDRRQYDNMLKGGGEHNKLEALKAQREAALSILKTQYAQAMGLGEKKPKNQLVAGQGSRMDDAYRQALQQRQDGNAGQPMNDIAAAEQSNEALLWGGFKKGLGLQPGEEIGQEGTGGGRPGDIGFAAQDTMAHISSLDYPTEPSPAPMPAPPPVEDSSDDMENYEDEVDSFYDAHEAWEEEMLAQYLPDYNAEKQQRQDSLQYTPSDSFSAIVADGLAVAQSSLAAAQTMGNAELVSHCEEMIAIYEDIEAMYTVVNNGTIFDYHTMQVGLEAVQSLMEIFEDELNNGDNGIGYETAVENLAILNDEIVAINSGMNAIGEAYLDNLDELYKNGKISRQVYTDEYRDYYQSVIERESLIEIESRTLSERGLTIIGATTSDEMALADILESKDVPLYSTAEDAVLAFKQEAMPLTLATGLEHSAVLDSVEVFDEETGQIQTYYYYLDVDQGTDNNVVGNALLGAGGGGDRFLLHTHPVNGGWNRYFSGDPANQGLLNNNPARESTWGDMGDTNVPTTLGYSGIYLVGSGAEVKLYEGYGEADIGSGHNTYANTFYELEYLSTIDLY